MIYATERLISEGGASVILSCTDRLDLAFHPGRGCHEQQYFVVPYQWMTNDGWWSLRMIRKDLVVGCIRVFVWRCLGGTLELLYRDTMIKRENTALFAIPALARPCRP